MDYWLAPEHPGPAAVEDAVGAFVWTCQHLQDWGADPEAGVALAGDSSGGALAVPAAVRLQADGMIPPALPLAHPNADMTLRGDSVAQESHGWGLEADDLRWFVELWLPAPDGCADPQVSPARADLTGLPPALLATAEHDPLRDEGNALAQQLRDVAVEVQHVPHGGLVHGFLGLSHVSEAAAEAGRDLFDRFGDLLRNRAAVSSH